MSRRSQKIMTQPINLIFRFLQNKSVVEIWLHDQKDIRMEGRIIGFDEYMNIVVDDAVEVNRKSGKKQELGRTLLKGDAITLICPKTT